MTRRHRLIRLALLIAVLAGGGCQSQDLPPQELPPQELPPPGKPLQEVEAMPASQPGAEQNADDRLAERKRMVDRQMRHRDIVDPRVLEVMERVPRHQFVPPAMADGAYEDHPLPIGQDQTISQPYIVALMTQLAKPNPRAKALDIGTGSGYQAAVLSELCSKVYSIEIVEPLAVEARKRLARLGYTNVEVRHGDGYQGWPEQAPFDIIIVAAAPDHVPQPLIDQLAPRGRIVIPVGDYFQELLVIEKSETGEIRRHTIAGVAFVPMTGAAQRRKN